VWLSNVVSLGASLLVAYKCFKALKARVDVALNCVERESAGELANADAAQLKADADAAQFRIEHLLRFWVIFAVIQTAASYNVIYAAQLRAIALVLVGLPSDSMHSWLEPVFDRLARPIFGSWVPFAVDALVERLKGVCALLSPAVRAVVGAAASPSVCDRVPAEGASTWREGVAACRGRALCHYRCANVRVSPPGCAVLMLPSCRRVDGVRGRRGRRAADRAAGAPAAAGGGLPGGRGEPAADALASARLPLARATLAGLHSWRTARHVLRRALQAQASASQHRRDYFDEDEAAALQQAARAAGRRRGPTPLAATSASSASGSEESLPGQSQPPPPLQHGGHHQRSVSALGGLLSYASSAVSETATGVRRRLAATTA